MRWEVESKEMVGVGRYALKQVADGRLRRLPTPLCILTDMSQGKLTDKNTRSYFKMDRTTIK